MPTVLIVDDSLSVRKVAERALQEAGLDVAMAASGEAALSWLSTHRPDLVIADIIMPDMSGFEVCAFIRAQAHMATMPVLLFSGFVDDNVTREAENCKANGVVKKPFQGAPLREQVMALLSGCQERDVLAPAPAMLMPVAASTVRLHMEPPIPVPSPVATPAPLEQLEDDRRILREIIQQLEARVAEQEKWLATLERQLQIVQDNVVQAVKDLSSGNRIEILERRLAEHELVVASAKQLFQVLADFALRSLTPDQRATRSSSGETTGDPNPDV